MLHVGCPRDQVADAGTKPAALQPVVSGGAGKETARDPPGSVCEEQDQSQGVRGRRPKEALRTTTGAATLGGGRGSGLATRY